MGNQEAPAPSGVVLTERPSALRFAVHVRPRASRSGFGGVRAGALEVSLASPPVDGAANGELLKMVARLLGIRRNEVEIVLGESSRTKVLEVRGISVAEVEGKLEKVLR